MRPGFSRNVVQIALVLVLALATAGCVTKEEAPPPATSSVPPEAVDRAVALAEKALAEGRTEDARMMLERALLADPKHQRAQLVRAELLLASGAAAQAAENFTLLATIPELAAEARQGQGIALAQLGQIEEALSVLEQAVAENAQLWRAWNAIGYCHDLRKQWAASEVAYDRAIALRPGDPALLNNRGFSRLMQRRIEESVQDLTAALRLAPKEEAIETNLRLALAWQGNYANATMGVRKKDEGRTFNNVGYVALLRGDYTDAESYLLQAMEADSSFNEPAWQNLTYLRSVKKSQERKGQEQKQ